jgi:hypothetical protein
MLSNNCASVGLSTGGSGCRFEARGGDTAFICSGADIEMPPVRFHLSGDIAMPNILLNSHEHPLLQYAVYMASLPGTG